MPPRDQPAPLRRSLDGQVADHPVRLQAGAQGHLHLRQGQQRRRPDGLDQHGPHHEGAREFTKGGLVKGGLAIIL